MVKSAYCSSQDQIWFPEPMLGCPQQPLTPAADLIPFSLPLQAHTHTKIKLLKKKKRVWHSLEKAGLAWTVHKKRPKTQMRLIQVFLVLLCLDFIAIGIWALKGFKWGNCQDLSATLRMDCIGIKTDVKTESLMKLSISELWAAASCCNNGSESSQTQSILTSWVLLTD